MKATEKKTCPVCKLEAQDIIETDEAGKKVTYRCDRCGKFRITRAAAGRFSDGIDFRHKLCAWLRNLSELDMEIPDLDEKSLSEIEKSIPEYNPSDKQYLFLRNIARTSRYPGDSVSIFPDRDYPLAWAEAPQEIIFYIRFLVERGLLFWTEHQEFTMSPDGSISIAVSPVGWKYLDEYQQRAIELSQAFVAMSFSPSMNPAWEYAIKPAINEAGYKACRINGPHQGQNTHAQIIAEIKNSLFIVAEVTGHEKLVYFEAGYAMGRNLPVIWCVHKDNLHLVDFDTRRYNHVSWKDVDELREKLYGVICAVVGRRKKI